MNVLLIGSGGREHAISWKINQSPLLGKLFIAPGNPGTENIGTNVPINPLDFEAVKQTVLSNHIDFVIVGPEEPLVRGLHDSFIADSRVSHIPVIGPQQKGAMLEGSKDFAKAFMLRNNIPTAKYQTFTSTEFEPAKDFLKTLQPPYVLKADGLAAGKGVVISNSFEETCETLEAFFAGKFGDASRKVVIEEFLKGIELSVFVLTDGNSYVILPEAKDYKRIGVGDTGLNTGGMGAVSPVPFANKEFLRKVEDRIIKPTIDGFKKDEIPYKGFIFIGLMNVDGEPFVIEYNVRMGDPETEVVMPRIDSDVLELLYACAKGELAKTSIKISDKTATTVIVVSGGYPENYEKGKTVTGITTSDNPIIFHAGTAKQNDVLVTSGGRVFACTGLANNMKEALEYSYRGANSINFEGKYFRTDIGKDLEKI
ncbi:MAG: phosphoribosylamine--glycine ligase [Bacteroidales bacterium]